ncbi:MAG: hypothetical protein ACYTGC_15625, partial [Planctomycetota bacterium]
GDDDSSGGDDGPVCCFAYDDDVLIIRSDMALFIVTATDPSGQTVECVVDLCEFLDDPDGGHDDDDDGSSLTCPADINRDGLVNGDDVLTMFINWGPQDPGHACDLDADGDVDSTDVMSALLEWGACQ